MIDVTFAIVPHEELSVASVDQLPAGDDDAAVDGVEPHPHRPPGEVVVRAVEAADEAGGGDLVELDEDDRVGHGVRRVHLVLDHRPRADGPRAGDGLPATVPAPAARA